MIAALFFFVLFAVGFNVGLQRGFIVFYFYGCAIRPEVILAWGDRRAGYRDIFNNAIKYIITHEHLPIIGEGLKIAYIVILPLIIIIYLTIIHEHLVAVEGKRGVCVKGVGGILRAEGYFLHVITCIY